MSVQNRVTESCLFYWQFHMAKNHNHRELNIDWLIPDLKAYQPGGQLVPCRRRDEITFLVPTRESFLCLQWDPNSSLEFKVAISGLKMM